MRVTTFGVSGLHATQMGLGLAALGRPGYITLGHGEDLKHTHDVDSMRAHAFRVLDAAWALGIRDFDTARSYGRAEEFLGAWLQQRNISPRDVIVSSKWGYTYTADWAVDAPTHEVKDHSLDVLRRQWAETQECLNDYVRLYQIHSATVESGVLGNSEVLGKLAELKTDGLMIGLSLSGPEQADVLRAALDIEVDGRLLFDAVQATWNLLEQSTGVVLADANPRGMVVIVKEALANGRLTPRNSLAVDTDAGARLAAEANRLSCTVDALALAAALAQPWSTVVLSGAVTTEHVESNVSAFSVDIDSAFVSGMPSYAQPADKYWRVRSQLAWN